MSQPLKDAARDILTVYGLYCVIFFFVVLTVAGDHYELWEKTPRPPNDAPLVKQVTRDVDGVFEAVEVLVEEVGELVR